MQNTAAADRLAAAEARFETAKKTLAEIGMMPARRSAYDAAWAEYAAAQNAMIAACY